MQSNNVALDIGTALVRRNSMFVIVVAPYRDGTSGDPAGVWLVPCCEAIGDGRQCVDEGVQEQVLAEPSQDDQPDNTGELGFGVYTWEKLFWVRVKGEEKHASHGATNIERYKKGWCFMLWPRIVSFYFIMRITFKYNELPQYTNLTHKDACIL